MAEESKLHQAGSFHPYFPILCTLQFICSVLLPDTKSCYSTSFGKCTNGPNSSNNLLRWYTVWIFYGNFVLFLGSVQLRAASKIRNCFCYLLSFMQRHHHSSDMQFSCQAVVKNKIFFCFIQSCLYIISIFILNLIHKLANIIFQKVYILSTHLLQVQKLWSL